MTPPARILAIDPGPLESAYVLHADGGVFRDGDDVFNPRLLELIMAPISDANIVAIEKIAPQGRARLGNSTLETVRWETRFQIAAESRGIPVHMITRSKARTFVTRDPHAGDKEVRAALIERFGDAVKGWKGSHLFAALAVAVTCADLLKTEATA